MTASAILTAAVALASLVLSACGAGERRRDAASVAQRFHAALGRDDGRAACMELSAAGWKVSAAGCTPTAPDTGHTTASWRVEMRFMYIVYLVLITLGIVYFSVIGLLHN